jgi:hypothetical protein
VPVASAATALPGPAAHNNNDGTLAMNIALLPRHARRPALPAAAVPFALAAVRLPGAALPFAYCPQRVPLSGVMARAGLPSPGIRWRIHPR